ncbi:MAG: elongation factor P maturation arginine rhamnosyltransferase EarP, partial [Candidatus Saccharibacteria bacterium]|nr:elongation factor P maturation arginine rhamnosyltransferase EarP [Moraxellaceae bacterium]
HEIDVTLWVDDLFSFSKLAPNIHPPLAEQKLEKITVCLWHKDNRDSLSLMHQNPLDILIEGFGCRIPDFVIAKMAQQAEIGLPPLWINLEYLSAESWAVDCHVMPSTHPQTGLVQYFWFPSFSEKSGGLLREANLIKERDEFQNSAATQIEFWSKLNITDSDDFDRRMSLFSYENTATHHLLDSLATDHKKTLLLVPEGKALTDISRWAEQPLRQGQRMTRDALTIVVLPFLNHKNYDQLLWACDLNFVRGEDSFIRAQWAGKPFIWHIYPQDDDVHLIKLNAFMDIIATVHSNALWRESMLAWNTPNVVYEWSKVFVHLTDWQLMAREWQGYLTAQQSLSTKLVQFFQLKHSLSDE